MNNSFPSLRFILGIIFSFALVLAQASVFLNMDFEMAKNIAQKENKLLMLKFTAQWCLPCKFMDKTVFEDKNLSTYMSERVIAIQVDIDQFTGMDLKEIYKVKIIPTIIFIHPNGTEISRKENSMGITDFKNWLETLVTENKITVSPSNPMSKQTNNSLETISDISPFIEVGKSNLSNSNSDTGKTKIENTSTQPNVQINQIAFNPAVENPNIVANEDQQKMLFGTYFVQLGAYVEMDNALKNAEELDKKFSQNASIVEDVNKNGTIIYKLNLGPFDSEEEADVFVQVLKDRHIDALIKKSEF
ncbi:MAG: thioredoxin family protein [Saprospiraceae bacterium]